MNTSGTTVYEDQTTVCMSIGRVDGFSADKIANFASQVIFTSNASNTVVPYSIADLQADYWSPRLEFHRFTTLSIADPAHA